MLRHLQLYKNILERFNQNSPTVLMPPSQGQEGSHVCPATPSSSRLQPRHPGLLSDFFNPEYTCPHSFPSLSPPSSLLGHAFPCNLCIHLLFPSLGTVPSKQGLSLQRTAANHKIRILKSPRLSPPITSAGPSAPPASVMGTVRA